MLDGRGRGPVALTDASRGNDVSSLSSFPGTVPDIRVLDNGEERHGAAQKQAKASKSKQKQAKASKSKQKQAKASKSKQNAKFDMPAGCGASCALGEDVLSQRAEKENSISEATS